MKLFGASPEVSTGRRPESRQLNYASRESRRRFQPERCKHRGIHPPRFQRMTECHVRFYRFQSIGVFPTDSSAALIRLYGLLPKNPAFTESGDGCADAMTV